MATSLLDYAVMDGNDQYNDEKFRTVLASHADYLRNHPETTKLNLDSKQVYRFDGDIPGLLKAHKIDSYLHWTVMMVNNIVSASASTEGMEVLLVPHYRTLDSIRQMYSMTNVIR
jgi:hypothetical protein